MKKILDYPVDVIQSVAGRVLADREYAAAAVWVLVISLFSLLFLGKLLEGIL